MKAARAGVLGLALLLARTLAHAGGAYCCGPGWYRRSIELPAHPDERRRFLEFDGAALATDVWVNGRHAGRHEGGYARFRIDVSGLLLNGQPYALHGVNYFHAGLPGHGLAVDDEDFRILKELGATGLRLVHFQHSQRAYDLADRLGLLLWTEIPLNSAMQDSKAFHPNLAQRLRELIRQSHHHVSDHAQRSCLASSGRLGEFFRVLYLGLRRSKPRFLHSVTSRLASGGAPRILLELIHASLAFHPIKEPTPCSSHSVC